MNIHFRVELSEAERNELTAMLSGGRQAARKLKRAQILLAADAGSSDEAIAACVGGGASSVPHQAPLRGRQPAGRPGGGATAGRRAQAVGQGGSLAGGGPPAPARPRVGLAGPWSCWPMRWSG